MSEPAMPELPELPEAVAAAWGHDVVVRRGPKRALTIAQILETAVAVADAEGLAAVSMSRLAADLGVATMALYRYVPAKHILVELAVDHALGAPPPAVAGETWREGLLRWAHGVQAAYRAHPWALHAPISGPPVGPNNVRWLENALAVTRDLPLTTQQRTSTTLVLSGFVRSMVTLEFDLATGESEPGAVTSHDYASLLRQLVNRHEFPEVSHALETGALEDDEDPDYDMAFGLDRLLDGVDVLIKDQRRRRRAAGRS